MAHKLFSLPNKLFIVFGILLVASLILILAFIHHIFNQRINNEIFLQIHNGGKTVMNTLNNDLTNLQDSVKAVEINPSQKNYQQFCNDRNIDFLCFKPMENPAGPALALCATDSQPSFCKSEFQAKTAVSRLGFGIENSQDQNILSVEDFSEKAGGTLKAGIVLSPHYVSSLQNLTGMEIIALPISADSSGLSTLPKSLNAFQNFTNLPKEAQEALDQFLVYSFQWDFGDRPYQFIFYPLVDLENNLAGALGVGISLQGVKTANRNSYALSVLFIISIVITFLALGIITAHSLLQPLSDLKNTVTDFLKTSSTETNIRGKDEISFLDEGFKQLTEKLSTSLHLLAKSQLAETKAQRETLLRLAIAAEYKDQETASHILRLSRYSEIIARHLHLSEKEIETIRYASPMHDIGKIGIPDNILQKKGPLTPEEYDTMKQHPKIGAGIFKNAHTPLYEACRIIALTHHEKWDGSGYPQGLKGEEIPLFGRIVAVADVFDALTTERYYKPAFPLATTLEIMREYTGTHFDPKVMEAFLEGLDEVKKVIGVKEFNIKIEPKNIKRATQV